MKITTANRIDDRITYGSWKYLLYTYTNALQRRVMACSLSASFSLSMRGGVHMKLVFSVVMVTFHVWQSPCKSGSICRFCFLVQVLLQLWGIADTSTPLRVIHDDVINGIISAFLALCAWNSPLTGEFTKQRPVTRSFGVFFDQRLNKRLSWVNNRDVDDLRRHRAHYDVNVMIRILLPCLLCQYTIQHFLNISIINCNITICKLVIHSLPVFHFYYKSWVVSRRDLNTHPLIECYQLKCLKKPQT